MWTLLLCSLSPAWAGELWLGLDATENGERMVVKVPYTWVEDGVIADPIQSQLAELAPDLSDHAAAAADSGRLHPVPLAQLGDEAALLWLYTREPGRSSRLLVEVWDADGEPAGNYDLGLGMLRLARPWLSSMEIDGMSVSDASDSVLSLSEALQEAPRMAPTTLLDVSRQDGRVRITTQ